MKASILKAMLVVLVAAVLPAAVSAQVRVVAPLYPPLVASIDGYVASGGLSYQLVQEAFRRAGLPLQVEIEPFARALQTAMASKAFAFPVARTPDREDLLEWIGPVNVLRYQLFRRSQGPAPRLTRLDQLEKRSVGVINDDLVSTRLGERRLGELVPVTTPTQLVRLLLSGRVDYVAATAPAVAAALRELALPPDQIDVALGLEELQLDQRSYLVAAKGWQPALTARLKLAFQAMQSDGTWDKLFRQGY